MGAYQARCKPVAASLSTSAPLADPYGVPPSAGQPGTEVARIRLALAVAVVAGACLWTLLILVVRALLS